jgi:hypothetical protein
MAFQQVWSEGLQCYKSRWKQFLQQQLQFNRQYKSWNQNVNLPPHPRVPNNYIDCQAFCTGARWAALHCCTLKWWMVYVTGLAKFRPRRLQFVTSWCRSRSRTVKPRLSRKSTVRGQKHSKELVWRIMYIMESLFVAMETCVRTSLERNRKEQVIWDAVLFACNRQMRLQNPDTQSFFRGCTPCFSATAGIASICKESFMTPRSSALSFQLVMKFPVRYETRMFNTTFERTRVLYSL